MGFLTPLFLLGLLAAALPVAIHLIRRENPTRVPFGSLRFLKQTSRKLILFQQIQQWLLMLLRAAVICLLVIAFARPLLHQGAIARLMDTEPEAVVVLLDSSLSMHQGQRFARALDEARVVLGDLSPGDEAAIVTFAGETLQTRALTTDVGALQNFVEGLDRPGYDRVRFFPALQLANDLLEQAQHQRRRIVMISDFQANGLDDAPQGWLLAPGVQFEGRSVADERLRNLSITDVRSPEQLVAELSNYDVLTRVRSTGTVFADSGELSLRLDGVAQDSAAIDLQNRSEAVVNFPLAVESSGQLSGELVLGADDFALDNHWYFTLESRSLMRVLVVNGTPSSDWYDDGAHWFVLALEGISQSPFRVTTVSETALDNEQLASHDAVVLLNTAGISTAQAAAINAFVEQGGAVWFAPGNRVDAQRFNTQFADLLPVTLTGRQLPAAGDYRLMADIDRSHPALRGLDMDWGARFEGYWMTEASEDADVLMRFDSGDPLLSERTFGAGRTMLLSTTLDLGWSNFPLQGLYVPFVHEVLTYLIQPATQRRAWQVGDSIDLSGQIAAANGSLTVTEPDGNSVTLRSDNPVLRARMPGFFALSDGSRLAVNIQPAAADLTAIPVSQLHDRILNPETTPQVSERVRTAQLIADIERPQRLWWWLIGLVMLLLLTESWVANRTYR